MSQTHVLTGQWLPYSIGHSGHWSGWRSAPKKAGVASQSRLLNAFNFCEPNDVQTALAGQSINQCMMYEMNV